jgi:hypothetical protein
VRRKLKFWFSLTFDADPSRPQAALRNVIGAAVCEGAFSA